MTQQEADLNVDDTRTETAAPPRAGCSETTTPPGAGCSTQYR
jgi:hypothetical protein